MTETVRDQSSEVTAEPPEVPPFARRGVLAVAGGVTAVLLAVAGRYGYHRDELYFRVAGEHLDWGYVDQPALIPLLGRVSTTVFGDSVAGLRVPAVLLTLLTVLLAALIARELGGGRAAQVLAAGLAATAPYVLATGHILTTGTADVTVWLAVIWVALRALRTGEPRWWVLCGAFVGIGLHAKHLVALLVVSLVAGVLLVGPRSVLRSPWLWAGAALAAALAAPNLIWQAAHDWPQFEMADQIAEDAAENRALFLPFQVLLVGPLVLPLWVSGIVGLLRDPRWQRYRALAAAVPVAAALVLVTGGQYYYVVPLLVALLAAGSVRLAPWLVHPRHRVLVTSLAVVHVGAGALLSLPLLPEEALRSPVLAVNETGAEQVGWRELTHTVREVYEELSPEDQAAATVFTANYGEAGALDRFGPDAGLPAAYSGHNSYHDWGAPPDERDVAIVVGDTARVLEYFTDCAVRARVDNGLDVDNEEQGAPIRVCRGMTAPWSEIWPELRHLN